MLAKWSCRRVIQNKHSTEIRACLIFRVNAHTDTRRRRTGKLNVGRKPFALAPLPWSEKRVASMYFSSRRFSLRELGHAEASAEEAPGCSGAS